MTVQTLYQWIDLLWIPVALIVMERGKKIFTCFFILACVLLLRLQLELLREIRYPQGILHWIPGDVFDRGVISYGVFIGLFLILAYYSPGSDKNVHLAASITIMIAAFCISTAVMVL